jgi:hypothetical protein
MAGARSHKPLPVAEWPALDREAWRNANVPGDEFTQSGIAAQWAPQSRENAELAYGRLLGFLLRKGRLTPVQHVGERIVLDDLRDLGHELSAQLAPHTVRGVYSSLAMAFSAMDPGSDRRQLNQIVARLARTAKSVRDITGNLLSPRELVAIGKGMMDEADSQVLRSSRPASLYRDGLLTMFLALCPLRVGAVSEMQIGLNLIVVDDRATVRFPPEERKKRRIGDVPLPQALSGRFSALPLALSAHTSSTCTQALQRALAFPARPPTRQRLHIKSHQGALGTPGRQALHRSHVPTRMRNLHCRDGPRAGADGGRRAGTPRVPDGAAPLHQGAAARRGEEASEGRRRSRKAQRRWLALSCRFSGLTHISRGEFRARLGHAIAFL